MNRLSKSRQWAPGVQTLVQSIN